MVLAVASVVGTTGCDAVAIQWDEPISAPADTFGRLMVSPAGAAGFAPLEKASSFPPDSMRCDKSAVAVKDGSLWFAVWLRRRSDASVAVVAARSGDAGNTWSATGVVDSVDVGNVGCARPRPSIAANGGYVHVAYSLQAPEGFGVFFAHSMDNAATFHSAVPVVYGDRLSATAVAADGTLVVVAYEDPSGVGHRIDVALSRTQGHTFAPRQRGSPDEMLAISPEVAVRGTAIALTFAQPSGGTRIGRLGHIH